MPQEVFIDASFWAALVLGTEQHHAQARATWDQALDEGWTTTTTNWTLYEAATFVNGRRRHDRAMHLLELARIASHILDASVYETEALSVFRSHADKRWSVVDCANFVCIRERQSTHALSFDRDFRQAQAEFGFTLLGAGAAT